MATHMDTIAKCIHNLVHKDVRRRSIDNLYPIMVIEFQLIIQDISSIKRSLN